MKFNRGDQVIYVPTHAHGDINHSDCERGFVTQAREDRIWCRFFYPDGRLRTTVNSECVRPDSLVKYQFMSQIQIDSLLRELGYHNEID